MMIDIKVWVPLLILMLSNILLLSRYMYINICICNMNIYVLICAHSAYESKPTIRWDGIVDLWQMCLMVKNFQITMTSILKRGFVGIVAAKIKGFCLGERREIFCNCKIKIWFDNITNSETNAWVSSYQFFFFVKFVNMTWFLVCTLSRRLQVFLWI